MPVLSADKLAIYNGALRRLGDRRLASLSENREPRRVLDDAWGSGDNLVRKALTTGEWNFAIVAVEAGASTDVEPQFGFTYAFDKPSDFLRMAAISTDPRFGLSLTAQQYSDEAGYWFTDDPVIYIRYVSGEAGLASERWPDVFRQYMECFLASEVCERLTNNRAKRQELMQDAEAALKAAKSNDAMNEGVKYPPRGSWVRARGGWSGR